MPGALPATPAVGKEPIRETRVSPAVSDDDDSDIEILAHTFKGVQITGTTGGLNNLGSCSVQAR